jgi:hypothetical protein
MAHAKPTADPQSEPAEDRPSHSRVLTAQIMEPALENTSRSVNKIRDDLGLETHRYVLTASHGDRPEEVVENVRIALLRAIAQTLETDERVEVREKASRRLLCWAEGGMLFGADGLGEISADTVVYAERRMYSTL